MRQLLVIHTGALGDFLMTVPIYDGFLEYYGVLRVDFWARTEYANLLSNRPYFGDVYSCDGSELSAFHQKTGWESVSLPQPFAAADTVIIFGQSSSRELALRLGRKLSSRIHWIQSFPLQPVNHSISEFLFRQFERLGYPLIKRPPFVEPQEGDLGKIKSWLETIGFGDYPYATVHPGSGGIAKIWPLSRWEVLLKWLLERFHGRVLVVLGPADQRLQSFGKHLRRLGCTLVDRVSLASLAALLFLGNIYVGNDSGVTHLAAALGTPTLAIFGPASHKMWYPQGRNAIVIQSHWEKDEIFDWPASNIPILPPQLFDTLDYIISRGREGFSRSA